MSRKGVFTITNTVTGKVYVGSSNNNVDQRLYDYWQKLHAGTHSNADLQADFVRYGSSNFSKEIVAICQTKDEVSEVTKQMFERYKSNMYNYHLPSTYDGGNPNATFGKSNEKKRDIIGELINIIDTSNLNSYNKQSLKKQVRSGIINSERELDNKIKLMSNDYQKELNASNSTKTSDKHSKDKIKKLADAYCEFSIYNTWEQQNNKIIFKKKVFLFGSVSEKSIPINSLEREIEWAKMQKMNHIYSLEREREAMKNKTLYSKPKPNLNFTVKDLAEKFCQKIEFNSYDLIGNRTLIFDNKYTLDLGVNFLGELYTALNSTEHKNEKRNVVYDHYLLWEPREMSQEAYVREYIYEYYDIDDFYILNNGHVLLFGGDSDSIRYIKIDEIFKTFAEEAYEEEAYLAENDLQLIEDMNNYDYYFDID